jgi:hypothetical protein
MSSHHAPELPYCRNCHYTLATPRPVHCGHCGQETDLHPPSVREMLTEYVGHYVAFDGPLWRTLWALVCLPGHLTNAYFRGQRRRYVLPLRVYLSASFVFFVGAHLLPHSPWDGSLGDTPIVQLDKAEPAASGASSATGASSSSSASGASAAGERGNFDQSVERCAASPAPADCSPAEAFLSRLVHAANAMSREQWTGRLTALAPYGMLAMQPVFAALLLLMFAGSGRRYAEHFVFSLHCHSLWFLALLLALATNTVGQMQLAVFCQGLLAMRNVYGLGWWAAIWRGVLLSLVYLLLLSLGLALLAASIAASAITAA